MAKLDSLQMAALQILSWQTPGYLCSIDASAFVSQGIEDLVKLDEALIAMQNDELVEFYTEEEHMDVIKVERGEDGEPILNEDDTIKPLLDDEGNIQMETISRVVDSGWLI